MGDGCQREIDVKGDYSLAGCVDITWMMGIIKHYHHSGVVTTKCSSLPGWVDVKTQQPVTNEERPAQYLAEIMNHTRFELIEPDICENE